MEHCLKLYSVNAKSDINAKFGEVNAKFGGVYIYIYISLKFCLVSNNTLDDKNFQPPVGGEIFISI